MDEKHTVDLVYVDFANAFDAVNHRFLLAKLKSSGIDGAAVADCKLPLAPTHVLSIASRADVKSLHALGPIRAPTFRLHQAERCLSCRHASAAKGEF